MALLALAQWVFFLKTVFETVSFNTTTTILFSDNQGAICVALEKISRSGPKHIDMKVHFVREQICSGKISLIDLPTIFMDADFLTKGLSFVFFLAQM